MLQFLGSPSYVPPSAILVNTGQFFLKFSCNLGCFLVGHFFLGLWVCLDQGDDDFILLSFLCLFHFCYSLGVLSLRGCVEIFGHYESCHATMQIHTNTNSCIYFTIHNVICLIIWVLSLHGSIISNTEHKKSQRNTTEAYWNLRTSIIE